MISPEITLLPESPYIGEGMSLEDFVLEAVTSYNLGGLNAERLIAFADTHLSEPTRAELEKLAAERYETDPPGSLIGVVPVLRELSDVEDNQVFSFRQGTQWDIDRVWSRELVEPDDETWTRNIVTFHRTGKGISLPVNWPALVPLDLDRDLTLFRGRYDTEALYTQELARVFFEFSYFDPQVHDPLFQQAIKAAIEHYQVPSKSTVLA